MTLTDEQKTRLLAEGGDDWQYILNRYIPEPNSGCWLWMGYCHDLGYALMYRGGAKRGFRVTRWILNRLGVDLSRGRMAAHTCDNPFCINPNHLFPATASENLKDCVAKGRHYLASRDSCEKGHKYEEGSYAVIKGTNHRKCRICSRITGQRNRKKVSDLAKTYGLKGKKNSPVTVAQIRETAALLALGLAKEEEL